MFSSALQDGILFGMVGAYDWDGGVLKEGIDGRIIPSREAFESEFPLELKNHAAYLGTISSHGMMNNTRTICQRIFRTLIQGCWVFRD